MSFDCHTCRDTGRVTQYPRLYDSTPIGTPCPDCGPRQMTQAEANEEARKRIAERYALEDYIDEMRAKHRDEVDT